LFTVAFAWTPLTAAQGQSIERVIVGIEAGGAAAVYAADLDGDGDSDVLSASSEDNKIAWYENLGVGDFGPQQVITTNADGAQDVFAADIDGDGDFDVLSASGGDDIVAWHENIDGQGTFSSQKVISANGSELEVADFNGDGDIDVLSVSGRDGTVAWYDNTDGQGTFVLRQVIAVNGSNVDAADIDGDGDLDVLLDSGSDDRVAWHENTDGEGSFGSQQTIASSSDIVGDVYAADLDDDGDLDVLSASYLIDTVSWYENTDGQGTFGAQQIISDDISLPAAVHTADFDGDGDQDVLASSSYFAMSSLPPLSIFWYENDGDGGFTYAEALTDEALSVVDVHAADLDGDGDSDVLSASSEDDKIAWYANTDGDSTFGPLQPLTIEKAENASAVYSADLDGDGDIDVLSASSGDDEIAWYENTDSEGNFGPPRIISTIAYGTSDMHAADLDGDGDIDVLSVSSRDTPILWYENTGGGSFGQGELIRTGTFGASDVYTSDLDGDGDLDLLSISGFDSAVAWHENVGDGDFASRRVIGYNGSSVYAEDIDGDGDHDVLSASYSNGEIAWYENTDGNGTFGPQLTINASTPGANGVYATDLDEDGDVDVLSASYGANEIAWYENTDGQGTFGPVQTITTDANGARDVYATDLNGNGFPDVISASSADDKIAWYPNLGDGNFAPQQTISANARGARDVHAADLDGDGDIDVLSASREDDKIAWYENTEGVLPVELVRFTAQRMESGVRLTWTTATETNNAGFDVERAVGGGAFRAVAFVDGAGTTTQMRRYQHADRDVPYTAQHVRYRLRQVDYDGTSTYSPAVEVEIGAPLALDMQGAFPNPAAQGTTIRYQLPRSAEVRLVAYDITGRHVATLVSGRQEPGRKEVTFDTSRLASGTYLVHLTAGGTMHTQKVTVVK
jgi:hypothetical protein